MCRSTFVLSLNEHQFEIFAIKCEFNEQQNYNNKYQKKNSVATQGEGLRL